MLTAALQTATETSSDPTLVFVGFFAMIVGLFVYWKLVRGKSSGPHGTENTSGSASSGNITGQSNTA